MKSLRTLSSLLAPILLASVTLAQTHPSSPGTPQLPQDPASIQSTETSTDPQLVSQFQQYGRYPHGPLRGALRPMGNYHSYYHPEPHFSPVGALIGTGLGAAFGAGAAKDQPARTRVTLGVVGGGLGAIIGGLIGGAASSANTCAYRRHWREQQKQRDAKTLHSAEPDLEASSRPLEIAAAHENGLAQ